MCEYDFSQDGNIDEVKKLEEIKLRREKIKQQKNQQIAEGKPYFIMFESPCEAEEFKILALPVSSIKSFPLSINKNETDKVDKNALRDFKSKFIKVIYSSMDSK